MAMARHQFTVTDEAGNVIPGVHIEVRREIPGQPLAALKSDRAGLVGITNPFDADSDGYAGFHVVGGAYQIRAYTGPSGAPTSERIWRYVGIGTTSEEDGTVVLSDREITAAGDVTIVGSDRIVRINKTVSQATNVNLLAAINFGGPDLVIKDQKGDATNYAISLVPDGSETIDGQTGPRLIDWPYGGLRLRPVAGGWLTLP